MAEIKTKVTNASVTDFLNSVPDETKRKDSFKLLIMFEKITGEKAKLWGTSIVGFGKYHYKSERSTQEGDWPLTGFSPRKQALTLYIMSGFEGTDELLDKLGKHTKSVGCLYIKKLADVDENVLQGIIKQSFDEMKKRYPSS
jgi:hypothetical protein